MIAHARVGRTDLCPVRFAAQHPTAFLPGLEDAITSFTAQRRMKTDAVAVGSWDYAKLVGASATEGVRPRARSANINA